VLLMCSHPMFWLCWGLLSWFRLFSSCYLLGKSLLLTQKGMLRHVDLLGMSLGKYVDRLNFYRMHG